MTPTAKLRWVDRLYGVGVLPADREETYVRVLQQWWSEQSLDLGFGTIEIGKGEWRDVELGEET